MLDERGRYPLLGLRLYDALGIYIKGRATSSLALTIRKFIKMATNFTEVDTKAINTIRVLAADVTAKAKSGHPGAPMGMAPVAHVLWQYFMNFNPKNPDWYNRDRFVLSNGHACVLQYSLLHMYGYEFFRLQDLQNFRQLGSRTPGHPERTLPGIEVTTGPLGQGIANAVGLAAAEKHMAALFNKPDHKIIDNHVYAFLGDGCLMEGISHEALAFAGHQQLNNLIAVYDDNHISIDGNTNIAFTEDVNKRFESYGWNVIHVVNGNTDLNAISKALSEAKQSTDKPTVIRLTTIIGYGSQNEGTHGVHGSPLKPDDIAHLKKEFGFDPEASFVIPDEVKELHAKKTAEGAKAEAAWNEEFKAYAAKYPNEAKELERRIKGEFPAGWEKSLPTYTPSDDAIATRKTSQITIGKIQEALPEFISGSADLTGSNLTNWPGVVAFQPPATKLGDFTGRYVHYGVREHGMLAIMNGIDAYGGVVAAGGTFLNFVSYAAGALRLSALSGHGIIVVATHDSIGVGEDGPTHQPIETLAHFRAIPNLMVWRPADGNETSAAYKVAIESRNTPSVLALTRQNLPQLEGSSIEKASKGGYILNEDVTDPTLIIAASGSEVSLSLDAAKLLNAKGNKVRVVSLPDFFTFDQQPDEYKLKVFPEGVPALSVEVMSSLGWGKYTHEHFNLDHFGASGPYAKIYEALEFTPEGIAKRATAVQEFYAKRVVNSRVVHAFKHLTQTGPGPFEPEGSDY